MERSARMARRRSTIQQGAIVFMGSHAASAGEGYDIIEANTNTTGSDSETTKARKAESLQRDRSVSKMAS